jgi:hypothetical protein
MSQVESVVPGWRKSTRCDHGNCVEVRWLGQGVAVRDNARPEAHLSFDVASWRSLLRELRDGGLQR